MLEKISYSEIMEVLDRQVLAIMGTSYQIADEWGRNDIAYDQLMNALVVVDSAFNLGCLDFGDYRTIKNSIHSSGQNILWD